MVYQLLMGEDNISLKDIRILPEYRSDTNPPLGFYIQCLKNSTRFDRAAGYFSSYGLAETAKEFAYFLNNNSEIRLVVSPQFS
ncbi:MAG: hypothetical protein HQ562_10515 [Candidatus Marinimicrobia bacterium]|nr:hypothetical protein [Candidatus Neomarinimicrobiota bacterium]